MAQNSDEWEETAACIECGAVVWPDIDRTFSSSPESLLCFECAERRGGVYDAKEERWTVPPDTAGLPDERRPHP